MLDQCDLSYLILSVFMIFPSCEKITHVDDRNDMSFLNLSDENTFLVTDHGNRLKDAQADSLTQTVLGNLRQNPFTIEKMAEAHRSLYGSTIQVMPTTDLYVKFTPVSDEDMIALYDTDEELYDFPLDYQIIEMGDYYQDIMEGTYPVYYAVVDPDFSFPLISYEIIEELYLDRSDPLLIAESMRLTGNSAEIEDYVDSDYIEGVIYPDGPGIPPQIVCPDDCVPRLRLDDSQIPSPYEWYCDCTVDPNQGAGSNYVTPYYTTNGCGCSVYNYKRKPGGCIKVEDTQFSTPEDIDTWLPVRRVKVITKDSWFTEDETWSDDNGCWKIDKAYSKNVWIWVKFSNDRCNIRGTGASGKAAWQWLTTIKDYVGKLNGESYNNVSVNYGMWSTEGSEAHRYWGAATVNNSLHEFYDLAATDGINSPEDDLDIYVGRNQRYGYALMSTQYALSGAVGVALYSSTYFFTGPFAPVIGVVGAAGSLIYMPDVYIGIDFSYSDKLKRLAYHEIAHTSHYSNTGFLFWTELATAEIYANGHGSANSTNAGIISLCESWAEHIALTYTDRTYGSYGIMDYLIKLEETRNETTDHIPIGFYHDLFDYVPDVVDACDSETYICGPINDQVNGFTNAQMFGLLDNSIKSPAAFKDGIKDGFGLTVMEKGKVENLFISY